MFSAYQRRLLRVPNGMLFGVCAGLGRRLGISTFLVRLITFIAFCATGFFPVGLIYTILAIALPVGPEYWYCNYPLTWCISFWEMCTIFVLNNLIYFSVTVFSNFRVKLKYFCYYLSPRYTEGSRKLSFNTIRYIFVNT